MGSNKPKVESKPRKRLSSSFNDQIAEMLTKIRNAKDAGHRIVDINKSNVKAQILKIFKEHGFIEDFQELIHMPGVLRVLLRYTKSRESVIRGLKRISTSGERKYTGFMTIPKVANGMGVAIISTSRGIMDGKSARFQKIGGEILCTAW